jgi:hypothetical protein
VSDSGYPTIDVEKTISPETFLGAPKPLPTKIEPSSKTRTAFPVSGLLVFVFTVVTYTLFDYF